MRVRGPGMPVPLLCASKYAVPIPNQSEFRPVVKKVELLKDTPSPLHWPSAQGLSMSSNPMTVRDSNGFDACLQTRACPGKSRGKAIMKVKARCGLKSGACNCPRIL